MGSMWVEKNGKTWRIREQVGIEKVTLEHGFDTKTAAKEKMILLKAAKLRGDALRPRAGDLTVASLAGEWWAAIGPTLTRVKSRESISGVLDRYIVRMLGELRMADLTENPTRVQWWVNDMTAGKTKPKRGAPRPLAPKTVRNAHGLLYQVMDWAVTNRYIRSNPCTETRLPDEIFNEHTYLTPGEADQLIAALDPHWRPLVLFLLATGCRWSEALGVRAHRLDVLGRRVTFLKKWIEDSSGQFHEEDVKSRRGRRTVSFQARVAEMLVPLTMTEGERDRHIFLTKRGLDRVRHKDFYNDVWYPARTEIGMPDLDVHDLRHTHVAWLIAGNVPLSAISRRLGHKSIAVTDDIYGHLLEEVDERLVATLDKAMEMIDFRGILGEMDPVGPPPTPEEPHWTPAQRRSGVSEQG
ncbi:MAG TPA: site-specific integrase [Micromonosporaceae bacterium]|nr:site-specific integrase [Micromonosporaceae bacterium]